LPGWRRRAPAPPKPTVQGVENRSCTDACCHPDATDGGNCPLSVCQAAKFRLRGAIEQRFGNTSTSQQSQQETASIEVPPHTKQEYTIIWRDTRQEGRISYAENGETKTASYSYRVGVELARSTVKDLPCPDGAIVAKTQSTAIPASTFTPFPTSTPYPTYTPNPTHTPYPTPGGTSAMQDRTPTVKVTPVPEVQDTPAGSMLKMGEWWKTNGVWLRLNNIEYETPGWIRVYLQVWNKTGQQIIFGWAAPNNFTLTDNTGHRYEVQWQYRDTITTIVQPDEMKELGHTLYGHTKDSVDAYVFGSSVKELYLSVEGVSRIQHAKWVATVPK